MYKFARLLRHALLLAVAVSMPTFAEREQRQVRLPAQSADAARVIVSYRADARLVREHPVQHGEARALVAAAYQRRADAMGQRAGLALRAGRAVGDRAHVVTARGIGSAALAARLALEPDVEYAVVDQRRRALAVNDPLFSAGPPSGRGPDVGQWYLRAPADLFRSAANVEAAWNAGTNGTNGSGIVVAVVDTGVWYDHVDLQGRLLAGYDFITDATDANDGDGRDSNAADPGDWCDTESSDSSWHGTQMAGIIAAATNNGIGMAGIAHGALVLPVRALGKCGGFDSDIAAGMLWAAGIDQAGLKGSTTPARVLNLSLGGASGEACSRIYLDAIPAITAKGAVIVAAAGNSAGRSVGAPANCPGVIAVAGLRHAGSKVGFSDLGPEISIAAPGGNCVNVGDNEPCLYPILTTSNSGPRGPNAGGSIYTDSVNFSVGTSYATPIVAGTAALMLSARPQLTPAEVISTIKRTARAFPTIGGDNGPDDPTPVGQCRAPDGTDQFQCYCTTALCGAGMLDSGAAVAAVLGVAVPPVGVVVASTPMPAVGTSVTLDGSSSSRSVVAYQWSILSGAPLATFASSTTDARVLLNTTGTGVVKVGLMVTDASGATSTAETTIRVASPPLASISPSTSSPAVGTTMTFDGSASSASVGRSIAKYRWAITSGSAVAEFSGGTADASSSVVTKASGSFTVRLTVTDDLGAQSSVDRSIVVVAAPVVEPPAPSGGGGGGAFSLGWILLLALAAALLWLGTGRPDRCKR